MSTPRQDLIKSAVSFLQDPKVQDAPLAKRIAFLESKGLTSTEIQESLRQASDSTTTLVQQAPPPSYTPIQPPPLPQRDWRDYFIMAVVSGGVGYGLYTLVQRYVMALIKPPSKSILETDKEALNAQFDTAAKLLEELQNDTANVRVTVQDQKNKMDITLNELESIIKSLKSQDEKRSDDLNNLKMEIDTIKDLLPHMMEKHKEAQTSSLNELQTELKSLKSLFINRRVMLGSPTVAGETPNGSSPVVSSNNNSTASLSSTVTNVPKPAIPAWQLNATKPTITTNNSNNAIPEQSLSDTTMETST